MQATLTMIREKYGSAEGYLKQTTSLHRSEHLLVTILLNFRLSLLRLLL